MRIIKNSKEITTLEVGDVVIFGDIEYKVFKIYGYYLSLQNKNDDENNSKIFKILNISKIDFVKNLGIDILPNVGSFPEVKSLEALTAIVSALFKEYEKQYELPKTWEEFCKRNDLPGEESYYISIGSDIVTLKGTYKRDNLTDRNMCTSKQEAEAFLALMQLRQLRKAYVKDWEPDLTKACFGIVPSMHEINVSGLCTVYRNLSFPTYDLANQFLTNFKDLLEIAKPLL